MGATLVAVGTSTPELATTPELGVPTTVIGWPVAPEAFTEILTTLRERYGEALPPVDVKENGCSYADGPGLDGRGRDSRRIDYLDGYLRAVQRAGVTGVEVRGYFLWSLLDNFKWSEGCSQRFGVVHVDFATLARTPKGSFAWYREAAPSVLVPLGEVSTCVAGT